VTSSPAESMTHDAVDRLFGACRYGFRDALSAWPDNTRAAQGLDEALVVVATYELERGRPQAAVSLLRECREHDETFGSGIRTLMMVAFGGAFSVIPLIIATVPAFRESSHTTHLMWSGGIAALLAGVAWSVRATMLATSINRTLVGAVLLLFAMQAVIAAGGWLAGRSPAEAYTWNLLLYAVVVGMLAIALDAYLGIAAAGYVAGYLVVSHDDAYALYMASAGNALFTATGVWRWRRR